MDFQVQPVANEKLEDAYNVLRATARWLQRRGQRQRISNTSLKAYLAWQSAAANFAVYAGETIAGVFSLPVEEFFDWPEYSNLGPAVWLRALATHPDFRGRQVGEFAVKSALDIVNPGEAVYLDCVSDFLPGYYSRLGFETLSRQIREYPGEGAYDITLMRHPNR